MAASELWIRGARVATPAGVREGVSVVVRGGRVRAVRRGGRPPRGAEVFDAGGLLLGPGLVDIHINGAFGVNFADAPPARVRAAGRRLLREGVTAYVPTLISQPKERLLASLARLAEAARGAGEGEARILGVHLEGPYLNPERRGAHPRRCLRSPSAAEFLELRRASGGLLRMITIAPELTGARELAALARRRGVVVCAGHSSAGAEDFDRGVRAGVTHVTHLYNAMRPFHHRDSGIVDRALTDDRVSVELIYDRRHMSAAAAELALRCKPADRVLLVSDATFAMKAPPGRYEADGNVYRVERGTIRTARGVLGGSAVSLLDCARFLARDLRLSPGRIFELAAANPARVLGASAGAVSPGMPADLALFDDGWKARGVFLGGRLWR